VLVSQGRYDAQTCRNDAANVGEALSKVVSKHSTPREKALTVGTMNCLARVRAGKNPHTSSKCNAKSPGLDKSVELGPRRTSKDPRASIPLTGIYSQGQVWLTAPLTTGRRPRYISAAGGRPGAGRGCPSAPVRGPAAFRREGAAVPRALAWRRRARNSRESPDESKKPRHSVLRDERRLDHNHLALFPLLGRLLSLPAPRGRDDRSLHLLADLDRRGPVCLAAPPQEVRSPEP
jgi:hypothetical protein